jgi:hypothetical protein
VIVTFEGGVSEQFHRKIELSGERALLLETEYEAIKNELLPLFDVMQQDLLAQ